MEHGCGRDLEASSASSPGDLAIPPVRRDPDTAIVQFACGRYAGAVKVTFRFNRPGSVAAWIRNRAKDLLALLLPALIVLKLTGVIDWSWWWVLSPLWISGILLAPVLCLLLALLGLYLFRRVASSEGLAAERYWMALRELFA